GIKIRGKVTRFSSSLITDAHDRTMRVEVDLWNGTAEEFRKFAADPAHLADLKEGPLPLVPQITGKDPLRRPTQLMAGMYGNMTLILKSFSHTKLIPSQAVRRQGGRTYIYVVKDGEAHMIPVELQVDDGRLAKVALVDDEGEVTGNLTGDE